MTLKSLFYDWFVAARYDGNLAQVTEEFRRICIDRIGIKDGDVVLDLGCGTGLNQPIIASRIGSSGQIIGIDASRNMLSHARSRAHDQGYAGNLQLVHGDLRNLEHLDVGAVDAVVATLIFSVVPAWRAVFHASFGLLKPGGRYGVMDNYWPNPTLRLWLLSWAYCADAKRPGFEPLQQSACDFVLEHHPPDAEVQFYVAHGSKSALTAAPDGAQTA